MRALILSAAIVTTLVLGVPAAGYAVEPAPVPSPAASGYTPTQQSGPTLAGSTAVGECHGDVPWIYYSVTLIDPSGQVTDRTVRLVLTNGTETTELVLGELVDNALSGRVLWPGASVNAAGQPTGWPGWAYENGKWVETAGNFAWTRGPITATLVVNPSLAVPLAYPPATPSCDAAPGTPSTSSTSSTSSSSLSSLPVTGLGVATLPVAIVGGMFAIAGIALLVMRRRRHS